MSNQSKLLDLKNKIHSADPELFAIFNAASGLEAMRAPAEKAACDHVLWQGANSPVNAAQVAENLESLWLRGGGNEILALTKIHAATAALEKHPRFTEAMEFFKPLIAERDRLEAAILSDAADLVVATEAAETAHREALAKAAEAAENDPEVVKAREALARLTEPKTAEPVKLIRGRQSIG
jgi:hypothetical protein